MSAAPARASRERPFPRSAYAAALLALLAANTVYFFVHGTRSEAVDAAAWLTLLLLFEAEAGFAAHLASPRRRMALRAVRLIAAASVIAASIGYVFEDDTLDAVNSALWIGVVVLLELELRLPALAARARPAFAAAAVALYGGLAVLVLLWALRGLWFDAYDAALWLVAYATLERDIMRRVSTVARS